MRGQLRSFQYGLSHFERKLHTYKLIVIGVKCNLDKDQNEVRQTSNFSLLDNTFTMSAVPAPIF